jgi:hypothetical protein
METDLLSNALSLNDKQLPNFIYNKTEISLRFVKPVTDTLEPNRLAARMEKDEPRVIIFNVDNLRPFPDTARRE